MDIIQEFLLDKIKVQDQYLLIRNFPVNTFSRDLQNRFNTTRIDKFIEAVGIKVFGFSTIKIHQFFIPELAYLLGVFPNRASYNAVFQALMDGSWIKNLDRDAPKIIDVSRISANMKFTLKDYQKNFLQIYEERKLRYLLRGYILAFEQGLGKTFTSLALMEGLRKDTVIIVAPKSTLSSVWANEIEQVFSNPQSKWVVGSAIPENPVRFYILNYESIDKIGSVWHHIKKANNIGIIVDESHNFRHIDAKRTTELIKLQEYTRSKDVLMMSGTPVKALGTEMIPVLKILDPLFDNSAEKIFKLAFGLNTEFALEILKNRLGIVMHRKLKKEVLNLPDKTEIEIKLTIPGGDQYTSSKVKEQVVSYIKEREEFYKREKVQYVQDFHDVIQFLRNDSKFSGTPEFSEYLKMIEYLKTNGYDNRNVQLVQRVAKINKYEKDMIYPNLPPDLKKKFLRSKSVIKYVNLKIMGEVIGGLLNRLRADMFAKMISAAKMEKYVKESEKKTICFTTFRDVAQEAYRYFKQQGYNPLLVYGDTSSNIKSILKQFKTDPKINPLIATIQTMSTGVTLTEASTVLFLNKPWRYVDYQQASDRVHRIGQDTPVKIYSFVLDTGKENNLSTRMEEIVAWSKDMFKGMVGISESKFTGFEDILLEETIYSIEYF